MKGVKLTRKILQPRHVGFFSEKEAEARQMRQAEGAIFRDASSLRLTFLVDPDDGMLVDAKFRALGPASLIGLAEATCEISVGKYFDQAARISAEVLEISLHDKPGSTVLEPADYPSVNMVLDALEIAMHQCQDIPLPPGYVSPLPHDIEVLEGGWPGFEAMTIPQKLTVIEKVIKEEILPYIEMDGGGVEVINILGDEVIIVYEGSCTTCYSSTGATLSYIQQILRAKVFKELVVTPMLGPFITE
ncbi:MAG: NifU family protein [Chlamydiae bacterium]|nr:NifU family protein [Chlamydiota bacterium]